MSGTVFGRGYSDLYDALYGDKDYRREVDLIEEIFRRHGRGRVRSVLDLGCGTGNHAIPLSLRGYEVTGVDRSAAMLGHARRKAREGSPGPGGLPSFLEGDLRGISTGRMYDAVLMMFAVLGYQLSDEDVEAALRNVRAHLSPGGLFVADVWFGPAVVAMKPGERVKEVEAGGRKIVRAASGSLDPLRRVAEVRYTVRETEGERMVGETREVHRMRYFFPEELERFFSRAEMELVGIRPFDDPGGKADETSWNVLLIARKAGAVPRERP